MKKLFYFLGAVLVVALGAGVYFLDGAMPIGSGYTAKYLCSQVFLADRDHELVFENDIKPTNPLFAMISSEVDKKEQTVTSAGFGFWSSATAVYRQGFGCTLAVDTTKSELMEQVKGVLPQRKPNYDLEWPLGEKVDLNDLPPEVDRRALSNTILEAFNEPVPGGQRNTQAVVVVYKDRIIAEKYDDQFNSKTPMLGWSMSKSVTNGLVGVLVASNLVDIYQPAPLDFWKDRNDPRSEITVDQLLRMSSGLEFEEVYGPFKDATYMLYDSKSTAEYAAAKPLRAAPDEEWYYSSGTTNILARMVRDLTGGTLASFNNFARVNLFDRLNMHSAIIEVDASGSFIGSSYMFATARDWARYGLFLKNDGVWNGKRVLPEGWVRYSTTPTPKALKGRYGAQIWLNAGEKGNPNNRWFPKLPTDLYYFSGFNWQIVAVIPSRDVIVVRLGATHNKKHWDVEQFIFDILKSIEEA